MSEDFLDRLKLEVLLFPNPNTVLLGLALTRQIIEKQLDVARHDEILQLRREHLRKGADLHPEDKELDEVETEQRVTLLLPKIIRGGFVLVMWSAFESSTKEMAAYASRETGRLIDPKLFRNKNFFDASKHAFKATAGLEAFPDSEVEKQLRVLWEIRNTLVHHDGKLTELAENVRVRGVLFLESLGLQIEKDHVREYIVPTAIFVGRNLSLIDCCLRSLAKRLINTLHPSQP